MQGYTCKSCGAPASVERDGTIVRGCDHTGTIVMHLDAVCHGDGGASDSTPAQRALAMFRRIGAEMLQRMRGHGIS